MGRDGTTSRDWMPRRARLIRRISNDKTILASTLFHAGTRRANITLCACWPLASIIQGKLKQETGIQAEGRSRGSIGAANTCASHPQNKRGWREFEDVYLRVGVCQGRIIDLRLSLIRDLAPGSRGSGVAGARGGQKWTKVPKANYFRAWDC